MKKIALLLALTMLLSLAGVSVSAASFYDTEGKNCETAVEVLASLGIVNGKSEGAYEPESTLTRAEMATIILRTMNMEAGTTGKVIFTDVPETHWAYANISAAYQMGIINGVSVSAFEPDSVVTYAQAVKMVVAALGYTLQAEAQGGYPSGYLSKAAQLDLLKGVAQEDEMTRGNMAILLYNALDVPMFLQSVYGEENYDYKVSEQDTLLSYYLKVDKVTSRVLATPMAQIAPPARTLLQDEVAIEADARIFKKGDTNVQDMLGVWAEFYVKTEADSDTPTVLAAVQQGRADVLDLAAKDIAANTTRNQLVYAEDDEEKKLDISGATLIWNGRVKSPGSNSDVQPKTGTVRVVSRADSAEYVIVESYVNYVVDTVITDTMEIYFMQGNDPAATLDKVVVDPNDRYTVLTDETGEPLTVEGCVRWDVVSVAESADKAVKKIIRCYNVVKGTVSEVSADSARIAGTEYTVAEPLAIGSLEVGQMAAYYLDFTGTVAAVNTAVDTSQNYGWLLSAAPKKGLDATAQFKIFTENGEMKIFEAANRVTLDDYSYIGTAVLDGVNGLYQNGQIYPQLVKYKTNEAKTAITELDTAENRTLQSFTDIEKTDGNFSMGYYMGSDRKAVEFNGTKTGGTLTGATQYNMGGVLFAKVRTTNETPVFVIPQDIEREEKYRVDTMRNYGFDVYNTTKFFAVYDVDEEYYAGACVVHNYLETDEGGTVEASYPHYKVGNVAMVTGTSLTLNEDGEAMYTLKLYTWNGKEEAVTVPEGFECLYRTANADFLSDPYWYNVKGQPQDKTLVQSTGYDNPNSDGYGLEFRPESMYLDAGDLRPGDVIHYTTAGNELTLAAVQMRVDYPGKLEIVPKTTSNGRTYGNLDATSESNYYLGDLLLMYATVKRVTADGPILSVNLANRAGLPTGETADRSIPASGNFVLWDKEKQTMRTITPQEIRTGDELFSIWQTNSQKMVIVYR